MDSELLLTFSGLQHFAFCPRQWALIFIEQQWKYNAHTVEGDIFHRRAHDERQSELRGDTLIMRGLRVQSYRLGVSGICDVVEFHRVADGISLHGREGRYSVYPVEYKKGAQKSEGKDADRLQLCAQAMCLEEMLACEIPEGALFYGETRRRERVALDESLRKSVEEALAQMRELFVRGYTPRVRAHKGCTACSLRDVCLPMLRRSPTVKEYIQDHVREEAEL